MFDRVKRLVWLIAAALVLAVWLRSHLVSDAWRRETPSHITFLLVSTGAIDLRHGTKGCGNGGSQPWWKHRSEVEPWHAKRWRETLAGGRPKFARGRGGGDLRLPFWFLASVPVAFLTFGSIRNARRGDHARSALCPTCGYDLRATPDRCPECGRPFPGSAPAGKLRP